MFQPLVLKPSLYRNGTEYQAKGRLYDSQFARRYGASFGPMLGFRLRSTAAAMTGVPRAILAYPDASFDRRIAIGTHSKLYVQNESGSLFDVTPVGFTAGRADSEVRTGFGGGGYGTGAYGTPRPDTGSRLDASVWSLQNWLGYLIGVMSDDGTLYRWDGDTGTAATAVAGAPSDNLAVVMTQDRFAMVLGADDDPTKVRWPDKESLTDWTPSATNEAGDINLRTEGRCVTGLELDSGTLILTTTDAHFARYVGPPFVYGFNRIGESCGAVSRGCAAGVGQNGYWWSPGGFKALVGGVLQDVPCDLWEDLKADLNLNQVAKISARVQSVTNEVFWHYPSAASNENDRYVVYNYVTGDWMRGRLARTCGARDGVFNYPLACSPDGFTYEHEVGEAYGGETPSIRTGPFEISVGDQRMLARSFIPDEKVTGQTRLTVYTRDRPNGAELTYGPYTVTDWTDVLFTGRQASFLIEFTESTARFGSGRLDLQPKGKR